MANLLLASVAILCLICVGLQLNNARAILWAAPRRPPSDLPRRPPISIDLEAVRAIDGGDRAGFAASLGRFTEEKHEKLLRDPAGREHYALLHYMSKLMSAEGGDAPLVDIGTRYAASALALASTGRKVLTFDVPGSTERRTAFRGKSEADWQAEVKAAGVRIQFYNEDLLQADHKTFERILAAPLILLDTHHLPYTIPFERQFLWRLMAMRYDGLVLLDDIHLSRDGGQMKRWWRELKDTARGHYVVHDLTSVGHHSGTGLLDFSHRVQIKGLNVAG